MDAAQPAHEFARAFDAVVDAAEERVFNRYAVARSFLIINQSLAQLLDGIAVVDGHYHAAQLAVGGVERYREPHAEPRLRERADAGDYARGRDRYVADAEVAQLRVVQHPDGLEHRLRVEERLAHAHVDDVVYLAADFLFNSGDLSRYLSNAEVAHEAREPRRAEGALQRAADLRRNAGGQPVALLHQHGLDGLAVAQPPEELARAVRGPLLARELRESEVELLRELLAQRLRQVRHLLGVVGVLLPNPLAYLPRAVGRLLQRLLRIFLPFAEIHIRRVNFLCHFYFPLAFRVFAYR